MTVHNALVSMKGRGTVHNVLVSVKGRVTVHNVLVSVKGRVTVHNALVSVKWWVTVHNVLVSVKWRGSSDCAWLTLMPSKRPGTQADIPALKDIKIYRLGI